MPNHIAILSSLLVGLAATLGTIVIHGFVVHTIVMTLRSNLQRRAWRADLGEHDVHSERNAACAHRASRGNRALGVRARYMRRGRRYQRGHLFIGWQLHDCGFRHRIAATMEAVGTI